MDQIGLKLAVEPWETPCASVLLMPESLALLPFTDISAMLQSIDLASTSPPSFALVPETSAALLLHAATEDFPLYQYEGLTFKRCVPYDPQRHSGQTSVGLYALQRKPLAEVVWEAEAAIDLREFLGK